MCNVNLVKCLLVAWSKIPSIVAKTLVMHLPDPCCAAGYTQNEKQGRHHGNTRKGDIASTVPESMGLPVDDTVTFLHQMRR
jgi:hypothetical protein